MKNQLIFIGSGLLIVAIGIFLVLYDGKAKTPIPEENGNINGLYSIQGVMNLDKPYVCNFFKQDDSSAISGVLTTDGEKIYGEFKIQTKLLEKPFSSFLIVKDGFSYTWTSLADIGYKAPSVKNASAGASPSEQAQIVGLRDEMPYECKPIKNIDQTIFNVPVWINLIEL